MSNRMVGIFFLGLLVLSGLDSGVVLAQDGYVLLSVVKQDEVNMSRLTMKFNRLPEYQIRTSGQRLQVDLLDTEVASGATLVRPDERLVQMLVGQANNKVLLSFLLRRPPYFVNGVKDARRNCLTIDIHWQAVQKGTRPAIARKLPGLMSVNSSGGVISRQIASKYRGNWLKFFAEYEPDVSLVVPIKYTIAPFPCLGLFENLDNFLPLEVLTLADGGEWEAAFAALDHVGLDGALGADSVRLLLLRADLQQRAGKVGAAQRYLALAAKKMDSLKQDVVALNDCLRLQQAYVESSASATSYELLAKLSGREAVQSKQAQQYLDLLQAEVGIAVGDYERSRILLEAGLLQGVGALEQEYLLRSADLVFLRGDVLGAVQQYETLEPLLVNDDNGVVAPHSLANYAVGLYRKKQYVQAIEKLKQLLSYLTANEERDMARYIMALALIHSGEKEAGYDLLHQISAGTIGSSFAKGKIADLGIQADDPYSRRQALEEYDRLKEELADRKWRAEMQFKHALALHILDRDLASIKELEFFLRSDHLSQLRSHAQALLAELLPKVIPELIENKKYFEALVLVEQNRDLLVATSRNFEFLIELGRLFTQLDYADSAERLYVYLLDVNDVGDRQEQVFAPLLKSLKQQGRYGQMLSYAQRYFNDYPEGKNRSAVFYLKLQALLAQGENDAAIRELQQDGHPTSLDIDRLAANLAWEHNELTMARRNIDAVVGSDFSRAAPEDQLLQAEIFLKQGESSAALKRYLNLTDEPRLGDQAKYRAATILLKQGQRKRGLKFLQQLVDMGNEGQWRSLARETLKIERFGR